MTYFRFAIQILLFIACGYWFLSLILYLKLKRAAPLLEKLNLPLPPQPPLVSVIMPACNEADHLESALLSKLKSDYPNAEFILVDDRSTDATPEIADRLASKFSALRVIHIKELPDGWLGKVHALQKGLEAAKGEWILFTDADVYFSPDLISRSMAFCLSRDKDHLALLPQFLTSGLLLNAVISHFMRLLCLLGRLGEVENPRSAAAVGAGAFSLFRRSALERTPGLEWLRLEVIDDIALGQMLKYNGARQTVASGIGLLKVQFYPSLKAMARGMEKNAFAAAGQFSIVRLIINVAALSVLEMAPFIALLPIWHPLLRLVGAAALLISIIVSVLVNIWSRQTVYSAFLWPLGAALMMLFTLRSGYLALRRGGINWRGTLYPLALLRAHRRLSLRLRR